MTDEKPKRKKPISTASRSLAMLRASGHVAQVVERWNAFARIRQDLFGFIDLVAVGNGRILAVQTTSAGEVPRRLEKIRNEPRARDWLRAGGQIEVHGWGKYGAKGKRKLFRARVVRVWLDGDAMLTEEDGA